MEKRYPQVCRECEPKVRDRLRKSAYAAKSDMLARSLAKKHGVARSGPTSSIELLLLLVKVAFWSSLAVHAIWNMFGTTGCLRRGAGLHETRHTRSMAMDYTLDPRTTGQGTVSAEESVQCAKIVEWSILVHLLTCWWNPNMRSENSLFSNRTVGKSNYYRQQALLLAIRIATFYMLHYDSPSMTAEVARGGHLVSCFVILLQFWLLNNLVKPASAPKLAFSRLDKPLIEDESFQYPAERFTSQPSGKLPASRVSSSRTSIQFPIQNLGSARQVRNPPSPAVSTSDSLLTPPPDSGSDTTVEDPDLTPMDWEPAPQQSQGFTYRFNSSRQSTPTPQRHDLPPPGQPVNSPFYGQIPPAPKSMEHRLRNQARAQPPQFRPVPDTQQRDWFEKMRLSHRKENLQVDLVEEDHVFVAWECFAERS